MSRLQARVDRLSAKLGTGHPAERTLIVEAPDDMSRACVHDRLGNPKAADIVILRRAERVEPAVVGTHSVNLDTLLEEVSKQGRRITG